MEKGLEAELSVQCKTLIAEIGKYLFCSEEEFALPRKDIDTFCSIYIRFD
jgi:hypothetical protein